MLPVRVNFQIKQTRQEQKSTVFVRGWMVLTQLLLSEALVNNLCLCKVNIQYYQIAGAHSLSLHRSSNVSIRHQTEEGGEVKGAEKRIDIF